MTDIPESLRPFHVTHGLPDTNVSQTHFASGHTPVYEHKHGVLWRGPWQERYDSTGIAARLHLRALEHAGVPVRAVASSGVVGQAHQIAFDDVIGQEILGEIGHLRTASIDAHVVEVDQIVPSLERVRACLYPGRSQAFPGEQEARARRRVLFTVWERDSVSVQMADLLKKFGQNWVPCERNARILREAGVENVHVVPHPMDPDSPLPAIGRRKAHPRATGVPVLFYSIAKWEPRKALHELLGAFLFEFQAGERALFGLKTSRDGASSWSSYPAGPTASLRHWLADPEVKANGWTPDNVSESVRIVTGRLSEEAMWKIHAAGHVYVSASHGEGFDFPAFDAVMARSRLIHVGFGGSEDYAPQDALRATGHSVLAGPIGSVKADVPGSPQHLDAVKGRPYFMLEAVHPDYRWFGAKWASVNTYLLRSRMRQAFEEGVVAQGPVDPSPWSFGAVGGLMKKLLGDLARANGTEVAW